MMLYKISSVVLGTLASLVVADFPTSHYSTFGLDDDPSLHKPWLVGDFAAASQPVAHHTTSSKDGRTRGYKDLKKSALPYYPLSEDPNSKKEAAHCEEISAEESNSGIAGRNRMTCYRCKDPKNGSSYERCSTESTKPRRRNSRGARSSNVGTWERAVERLSPAGTRKRSRKRDEDGQTADPYHFGHDYFHPEASAQPLASKYEKSRDKCEKVVRDSMVCTVCKDRKANGSYEQCSYVAQPNDKSYAYSSKSSSSGEPRTREQIVKESRDQKKRMKPEKAAEQAIGHLHYEHEPEESSGGSGISSEAYDAYYSPDFSHYDGSSEQWTGREREEGAAAPSNDCKTVQRDGQTCSVCTNPKTGGKSEKCSYAHEPKDKVYEYSKSKSFGYPEHTSGAYGAEAEDESGERPSARQADREAGSAEDYSGSSGSSDGYSGEPYAYSESERVSEKVKGDGDCQQVRRRGMLCTVCKDPKTGADYEQCNYSYDPEDKVYAYSKSSSFGSPYGEDDFSRGGGSEEQPEESSPSFAIFPTSTSALDYVAKASESSTSSTKAVTTEGPKERGADDSRMEKAFYDAKVRRDEIEKIVKDIETVDKSKCKKSYRSGMTCYRCTDDKGFTNEECVYVAEPETERPRGEATEATNPIIVTARAARQDKPLDPLALFTSDSEATKRKVRDTRTTTRDKDEELKVLSEEIDEAEPYELVEETRPVFDRVLGMTLPAYMVEKSPQEIEFDKAVENF